MEGDLLCLLWAAAGATVLTSWWFGRRPTAAAVAADRLHPLLRIEELQLYQGPIGVAQAALQDHGIPARMVTALRVYRGAQPGTSIGPLAVRSLLKTLVAEGSGRGCGLDELAKGSALPVGQCLWFVQVAGQERDLLLCFMGPDRGLSDYC
jgi:hypothetical protein